MGGRFVVLEGIEVAFIVVSFGANARQLGVAVVGGVGAIVVIGVIGFSVHRAVTRIPRSVLQLVVGVMLTTFGTFWSLEGIGVDWPGGTTTVRFAPASFPFACWSLATVQEHVESSIQRWRGPWPMFLTVTSVRTCSPRCTRPSRFDPFWSSMVW